MKEECELEKVEVASAVESALTVLVQRTTFVPADELLPLLTDAIVVALYKGVPAASSRRERTERENTAIKSFCHRVYTRPERKLEVRLRRELLWFFLGVGGPRGPLAEARVLESRA